MFLFSIKEEANKKRIKRGTMTVVVKEYYLTDNHIQDTFFNICSLAYRRIKGSFIATERQTKGFQTVIYFFCTRYFKYQLATSNPTNNSHHDLWFH